MTTAATENRLHKDGTETPQGLVERPGNIDLADFRSPAVALERVGVLLRGLVLEVRESLERSLGDEPVRAMRAEAENHAAAQYGNGNSGVALEVRLEISTDIVEERAACAVCREECVDGEATAQGRLALCGHSFHREGLRYYAEECGVCSDSMCPMCLHGYK